MRIHYLFQGIKIPSKISHIERALYLLHPSIQLRQFLGYQFVVKRGFRYFLSHLYNPQQERIPTSFEIAGSWFARRRSFRHGFMLSR